jgi:hypothetical protein
LITSNFVSISTLPSGRVFFVQAHSLPPLLLAANPDLSPWVEFSEQLTERVPIAKLGSQSYRIHTSGEPRQNISWTQSPGCDAKRHWSAQGIEQLSPVVGADQCRRE